RNCSDSPNNCNNPPVNNQPPVTNNNQGVNNNNSTINRNNPQETLQALLVLMNNNPGLFNNMENQTNSPKAYSEYTDSRKKPTELKMTNLIDFEEAKGNKDPDIEMEEVHKDQENLESHDPVVQNQEKNESAKPLEASKIELPKVNKKKEDVKVLLDKERVVKIRDL
ncbi:20178_t:CDS:2, partial [Racocetra persica]